MWLIEGSGTPVGGQSEAQLRKKQAQISYEKRQKQRQLRITKEQQRQLVVKLNSARAELNMAQHRLRAAQQKLEDTRGRLRAVKAEHTAAKEEYDQESTAFGDRLRALYENGTNSYLAVVLESESFSDFSARTYLTQLVVESDVEIVRRIQAQKNALARQQQALELQEHAEARYRTEVQRETVAVQQYTQRVRSTKAGVDGHRTRLEIQFAELDATEKNITVMLRRFQSRGIRYTGPSRWTSQYYMPVRGGRVGSGFGNRYHPILHKWRMHKGIDISHPNGTGTPIHAAADGLVTFAGALRGYGNTIMIDHGGQISTLYAHCRRGKPFAVGRGAVVKRGQVIAYMGSTGLSTGPHVHFEVRRRGVAVNPAR
jgi:murein DD-endopeptidase MepM/ murein hydrolase activator NlpD